MSVVVFGSVVKVARGAGMEMKMEVKVEIEVFRVVEAEVKE